MNKKFLGALLAFGLLGTGVYYNVLVVPTISKKSQTIETVYGSTQVTEPVLLEILQSKPMQRLKQINQYGIIKFAVRPDQDYTRYEHSLGVFYLIRKFGGSLEEQVAGLIHDISHTAFSHVADFIYETHQNKYSYQDNIFKWYLEETGLLDILKKHNLERVANFGKTVEYKILKDDLPHLCADRLEYNLYGGYVEGWLTKEEMQDIVSKVAYYNNEWVFTDQSAAEKFAEISIRLNVQNWASAENAFVSNLMAQALKRAFALEIVTHKDFHFSTDHIVWGKLNASNDQQIQSMLKRIKNYSSSYKLGSAQEHDYHFKTKFRGLDPFVKQNETITPLSKVSKKFARFLENQRLASKEKYIIYT